MNIFQNAPKTFWVTPEYMKWRETWDAIYEAEKALTLEKLKEELNNEKLGGCGENTGIQEI